MKTIQQIKKEQEEKLSRIFKDLGIFFAFSQEQFNKSKKAGVTYVDVGHGMIIPKENVQEWKKRYMAHCDEAEKEYAENVNLDQYIKHELYNYECFYTGNYTNALEPVQIFYPHCTIEDVKRVFYAELPNAE